MKRYLAILTFATFTAAAVAQDNYGEKAIEECRRLYAGKEYTTALTLAKKIDTSLLDARTRQEMELIKALATFSCNALEGRALMLQYLADYPSAKEPIINCYIAESYYYTNDFQRACEWFEKSDLSRIAPELRDRSKLYYALSLQECGKEKQAVDILRQLIATGSSLTADAIFHIAAIDYDNNSLQNAYKGFKSIEFDDKYYLEIPYYLAGIYLKQGDTDMAKVIAQRFIADHGTKPQGIKMHQILGASEYALGNYSKAVPALTKYVEEYPEPQRIAKYQLGLSLFETGKNDKAMRMFDSCSDGDDAIAQNSFLHIGIIQLKRNDINGARMAFEQAANMRHDKKIREEALYNYALCIHQTRYSPFAESVKVFESFLNEYPKSKHASQVSKYLVEVYMNTRNYDVALQSINKIKKPSKEILEAKQKVLYRLGVQEFINGDMNKSIEFMNKSLSLKYNKGTEADANYWKGEALYNKADYDNAAGSYSKTIAIGGENRSMAIYGLGYSRFQKGMYDEARKQFELFVKNKNTSKELLADAYNRIADCHFYNRSYANADKFYKLASSTDKSNGDYALYRSAITLGLSKDYQGKVNTLQQLIDGFPESTYAEKAYYEMGRAYIEQEKYSEAVATYDRLMKRYPKSSLARRAATEKAMVYNTTGELDKAVKAYKEIIEKYPYSTESQVAVQDLKNIYVEMGKGDEFAKYASKTKGMQSIQSNEIDTLTYIAAEKLYNRGNADEAKVKLQDYLKNFPEGAYRLDCHYYLGVIFNKHKNRDAALQHFEEVIAFPDNKYSEEAMFIASDLYFNRKDYKDATKLYKLLIAKSSNEERRLAARTGIMRASYILKAYDEVIRYSSELMAGNSTSPELKREATYKKAKAEIATNKKEDAMKDLAALSGDTRTKEGAEAKYLLAQMLFDQNRHDECEKEIMEYIEMSTPHAYWLARSFVLLADLYEVQGKTMEAKQYLLSLQNNYSGDDDIADMISTRLERLITDKQ